MKMMMKAEIASEMSRSRTQTPKPARRRGTGAVTSGSAGTAAMGLAGAPPGFWLLPDSGMRFLLYTEPVWAPAGCIHSSGHCRSVPPARFDRGTIAPFGGTYDAPETPASEQACAPQLDPNFPVPRDFKHVRAVGRSSRGRRGSSL